MDKKKLVELFVSQLENDLQQLEASIKASKEEATHEESKPENEYDTRALEAGYLVKAQSKRVLDARETLSAFKHLNIKNFSKADPIQSTALIAVDVNGKKTWFFYMSVGGGLSAEWDGKKIQVITPASPLGEALLGLKTGDFATVEQGDDVKEYEILSVE